MLEFIAGLAVGAGTMLAVAVAMGARWRRKRRRVDELHAEMLRAVWDVQDAAAGMAVDCPRFAAAWQANRAIRDTAAARYFAAVGE